LVSGRKEGWTLREKRKEGKKEGKTLKECMATVDSNVFRMLIELQ